MEQILGDTSEAGHELPTALELGSNVIQALFDSEIAPLMAEWEQLLGQNLSPSQVQATLGAHAELLVTVGEMLNWIPLAQIGEKIQTALTAHPEAAVAITELSLAQLLIAQNTLLNGDPAQTEIMPEWSNYCPELESSRIPSQSNFGNGSTNDLPKIEENQLKIPTANPVLSASMPLQDPLVPVLPQQAVRVDLSRLERINNHVGELFTQENSLFSQSDSLTAIMRSTQQRIQQFERFSQAFQDALDSLTLHSQTLRGSRLDPAEDFDPLQLDRYSLMHGLMQEAVEEMLQLEESFSDMSHFTQQTQQTLKRHRQTLKQVRDDLIWARMLPFKDLVQRFPRMVRDLSSQLHKSATLVIKGSDTLIDKGILEKLYDPLVHLIRNALDHGVEAPEQRIAIGKPPEGTLEIHAYYQGTQTCIEIIDDGGGISLDNVIQKAIRQGLITPSEAGNLSPQQVYELLFRPGFSTATSVTEISGRGVGLDVVRLQVQQLKGWIEVDSQPQRGTTITIRLPLTLTVARLLIVKVEAGLLAFPIEDVVAVVAAPIKELIESTVVNSNRDLDIDAGTQAHPHDQEAINPSTTTLSTYLWQGQRIPVYSLNQILPYHYPLLVENRDPIPLLNLPDNSAPPFGVSEIKI
ncbi:MAG: hypothetical protein HC818_07945 [Synechococcaceae cyanobacterium RM1_1_27]|nr:hypothetical protein [Synechococcaceae cyanobacterium RM1_1_27]